MKRRKDSDLARSRCALRNVAPQFIYRATRSRNSHDAVKVASEMSFSRALKCRRSTLPPSHLDSRFALVREVQPSSFVSVRRHFYPSEEEPLNSKDEPYGGLPFLRGRLLAESSRALTTHLSPAPSTHGLLCSGSLDCQTGDSESSSK